jgi:FMN-dependent NADH-azoreductase
MRLLRIDSSARTVSVTRQLTAKFAEEWKENYPDGEVVHRDLLTTTIPLILDDWSATHLGTTSALSPAQRSYLSTSDELIGELSAADTIVIGAPMYNFSIPSPLKAWIDQIVRMGKTFTYGANGPGGLLEGKKVVVITARGGAYDKGTATAGFDFQEPYLRHIFSFIGLNDVTFIHVDNQAGERAGTAFAGAVERITGIVSEPALIH